MGLFKFLGNVGERLFGGGQIDEGKIRQHLLDLGLRLNPLTVVAHPDQKMVSLIGRAATLEDKEKAIVAAGNIQGVESVDDRLRVGESAPPAAAAETDAGEEPPAGEQPTARFYTVEKGDTLSAIAKREYGNAGKYPLIFEANRPMLSDPDKIYPGQVLRIPPLS
ncbi:MAG: peptidoglycan-binding protein LysM [Xanthomonadales bacterium]|nr:peptidoglycan-binding protein LysM [Xanthomonadales bacterium]